LLSDGDPKLSRKQRSRRNQLQPRLNLLTLHLVPSSFGTEWSRQKKLRLHKDLQEVRPQRTWRAGTVRLSGRALE
jgi:hypothetical protein